MEFRHDVRFGGQSEPRRIPRQRPTVNSITVTGADVISESELRRLLGIEEGKSYDFFRSRDGVERIENHLERRRLAAVARQDAASG